MGHNKAQKYKNVIKVVKTGIKKKNNAKFELSMQLGRKSSKYGNEHPGWARTAIYSHSAVISD